jgi:type II secretory pathway pseudopilin PulG
LELLLALALFAAGTVAVIELIQRAHGGMAEGENVLTAVHLAQRCQDLLRTVAYGNLVSQASTVCTIPSGAAFARFSRTATATPQTSVPPYNTASLTRVDVQISWPAPGGTASITLSTLRSAS